jgi:hypothetical protein
MNDTAIADRVIAQGRALVRAVETLEEIEPTWRFEPLLTRLLLEMYRRKLRGIIEAVPDWAKATILGASSGDKPMVLWVDKN